MAARLSGIASRGQVRRRARSVKQRHTPSLLVVSPYSEDGPCLQSILGDRGWTIYSETGPATAVRLLRRVRIPIVLCERDLASENWIPVFEQSRETANPPLMIVASRTADNYLWAEVLNLGGFDVLAKPFSRDEVRRVLDHAWRQSESGEAAWCGPEHGLGRIGAKSHQGGREGLYGRQTYCQPIAG